MGVSDTFRNDETLARSGAPNGNERNREGLLSALAEAPDLDAATAFLLTQIASAADCERAAFLQFDQTDEHLVLVGEIGNDGRPLDPFTIAERTHPWMVASLSLSPVVGAGSVRGGPHVTGDWVALPMARPHYRGAPPLWTDAYASNVLAAQGARLIQLPDRRFSSAPGGVIVLYGVMEDAQVQALASTVILAGPVLFRVAAHMAATRSEERVRQERSRYKQMLDALPDPVVITSASNDIVVQNSRAERLLFIPEENASVGRQQAVTVNNLLFTSFLSRSVIAGTPTSGPRELNLVDPDEGHDLLFEVLSHPLGERVGPEDAVLSVLRDVTDLRRAANQLERQVQRVQQAESKATAERDRLNLILENVADPILVTDSSANTLLMNRQAESLFHGPAAAASRTFRVMSAVRQNDTKVTSHMSDFALTDERGRRERMVLTQPEDGTDLPMEVVSGKILNPRGEPIAIVSVLHDLRQQVDNERLYEAVKTLNSELEGRVAAATADLAQQNLRLQWQSEELTKANKLKSDFLASMSHELRTPLNAIIGYSALLLDGLGGALTAIQTDYLTRARASAGHLLSLINDVLDLAKIEAGKMPVRIERVRLGSVLSDVVEQVEPMVQKKELSFAVDVRCNDIDVETDKTKLKQILLNLLSNAIKFTNRGSVRVLVERVPGQDLGAGLRISVVDTGVGIKEEELETIWEDFRQLDQSRTRSVGGTGLGLSITKRLTAQLGGTIEVRSTFGEGSTFTLSLPANLVLERVQPEGKSSSAA